MAAVATPKICWEREREREREREKRKRKEERKWEERKKREERKEWKGDERKSNRCIMVAKHSLGTVKKNIKDTERAGKRWKKRQKRRKYSDRGKIWDVRIGSVFYSSIKPYLGQNIIMSILFKLSGKWLLSKLWAFLFGILPKSMYQITQIKFENCKVFIASEGAHAPQDTPFQRKICKVLWLIVYKQYMFQSITQEPLCLLKF